jgi:hypothetical protein
MSTALRRNLVFVWLLAISLYVSLTTPVFSDPHKSSHFDELDVQRINIREPDGTLRMVLSNTAEAPGIFFRNKEHRHPSRKSAGILFFNDEGTENGGIIFDGSKRNGEVQNAGHLSFDQYEQDQVLTLEQTEENGQRTAGLTILDQPSDPIPIDLGDKAGSPEGDAALRAYATHRHTFARVFVGKTPTRDSTVVLRDATGVARLQLAVTADGIASIEFLDTAGHVTRRITDHP